MPQSYPIRLYYDTGFGPVNIPDRPQLLDLCVARDFPALLLRQDRGLAQVQVSAKWDDVKNADYAKIGESYYAVGCPAVNNDGTVTLPLQESGLMGLGGPLSVQILDGWVTRAHAGKDELFGNILPEPFQLSRPVVIDNPITIDPLDSEENQTIVLVGSTVDLSHISLIADEYKAGSGDVQSVVVPKVPAVEDGTTAHMQLPTRTDDPDTSYNAKNKLPNLRLFDFGYQTIKDGVQAVRSLGLDTAITACYTIPGGYYTELVKEQDSPRITDISGIYKRFPLSPLGYEWETGDYEVKNKKVFSLFADYHLRSIASGAGADFPAQDIYREGKTAPEVVVYTDPTPAGCPFYAFAWYRNRRTLPFENAVKGSPWQNTPISFTASSGYLIQSAEANMGYQRQYGLVADLAPTREGVVDFFDGLGPAFGKIAGFGYDVINKAGRTVGTALGAAGGAIGESLGGKAGASIGGSLLSGVGSLLSAGDERAELKYNAAMRENMQAPDIKFPRADSIQNYIGNGATAFRTRPHIEDTKRLDRRLTMYGYSQDKPYDPSDMTNRQFFNFLQFGNLTIKTDKGLYLRKLAESELAQGVRIWHVLPNSSYYDNNPIKEGGNDNG